MNITVRKPASWNETTPLVVVLDQQFLFPMIPTSFPAILFSLEDGERNDDYTPWPCTVPHIGEFGGQADRYLSRLLPAIEQTRSELQLSGECGILGLSLGALFACYASIESDRFSFLASISGSFWYPGWTDYLRKKPSPSVASYFCAGENEGKGRHDALKEGRPAADATAAFFSSALVTDKGGHLSHHQERVDQSLAWMMSYFQR